MTATTLHDTSAKDVAPEQILVLWKPDPDGNIAIYHDRFFAAGEEQRIPAERKGLLHGVCTAHSGDPETARFLMKVALGVQADSKEFGYRLDFLEKALQLLARHGFKAAIGKIPKKPTDWRPDREPERVALLRDLVRFCGRIRPHRWADLSTQELEHVHTFLLAALESHELHRETGLTEEEIKTALWKTACTKFIVDRGEMSVIPELYAYLRGWTRDREIYPAALSWLDWDDLPNLKGGFPSRYIDGGGDEKYLPVREGSRFATIAGPEVEQDCAHILSVCGHFPFQQGEKRLIEVHRLMLLQLFALFFSVRELAKKDLRK